MKIGCFALIEPFTCMQRQFELIREMGLEYGDLTDNHNGGMLGVEYGFSSSISLETHPAKIRAMAGAAGITLTSFCAHANLLDPSSPDTYATTEIIKAIRSLLPKTGYAVGSFAKPSVLMSTFMPDRFNDWMIGIITKTLLKQQRRKAGVQVA